MNLPPRTALGSSHRFSMVVFSLSFVSTYCYFPPCSHIGFLVTLFFCLFSIHVIIFFIVPCYLVKKDIISVLLNLLRFVLCLSVWSVLDRVPCALEKKVYSEFCGCNALKISIKSNCSIVPFRIFFALLIFYLEDVSTDASEVFKSPAAVAVLPMSPFMSVRICLCTWVCRYWVLVEAMVFPVVMYGCENWTVKKAEC